MPIGSIQGPVADAANGFTHASPLVGSQVTTTGVVRQKIVSRTSAGQPNYGFFLQSTAATADGDPLSSDGIFVFQGRFRDLIGGYLPAVGDEIVVRARVTEFFNLTQLTSASLVSLWLAREVEDVRVAHVNADWPKDFPGDEARGASDHDPVVTRYLFAPGAGG